MLRLVTGNFMSQMSSMETFEIKKNFFLRNLIILITYLYKTLLYHLIFTTSTVEIIIFILYREEKCNLKRLTLRVTQAISKTGLRPLS